MANSLMDAAALVPSRELALDTNPEVSSDVDDIEDLRYMPLETYIDAQIYPKDPESFKASILAITKAKNEDDYKLETLHGVVDYMRQEAEEIEGDDTEEKVENFFLRVIAKIVRKGLVKLARFVMRLGARILFRTIRTVLKDVLIRGLELVTEYVVRPVLSSVVEFLIVNPEIAIPLALVGGVAAFGYIAYKKFFDTDKDKGVVDSKADTIKEDADDAVSMREAQVTAISTPQRLVSPVASAPVASPLVHVAPPVASAPVPVHVRAVAVHTTPIRAATQPIVAQPTIPATAIAAGATSVASAANRQRAVSMLRNRSQGVTDAITRASQVTGVPANIMNAFAAKESSFNPSAHAGTSSARGLFQFLGGTWRSVLGRYGHLYGLGANADPLDAYTDALIFGAWIKYEIYPAISRVVPSPSATDLYMGHFLGAGGGATFLRRMRANPNGIAANDMTAAAAANRSVFYDRQGNPRTYAEIYALFSGTLESVSQLTTTDATLAANDTHMGPGVTSTPMATTQNGVPIRQSGTPTPAVLAQSHDLVRGPNGLMMAVS